MVDIAQRLDEWAASPVTTKAHIRGVKAVMRIAADRIRELEQDREKLLALSRAVMADQTYHDTLAQRVNELEQDAARYRYLRDEHIGDDPDMINLPRGKRPGLDAAIDAARGGKGGRDET